MLVYVILISNLSDYVILRVVLPLRLLPVVLWTWKGDLAIERVLCYPRFPLKHKAYITRDILKTYINVDLIGTSWHSVRIFAVTSYFCLICLWHNNSDILKIFFSVFRRAVCNFQRITYFVLSVLFANSTAQEVKSWWRSWLICGTREFPKPWRNEPYNVNARHIFLWTEFFLAAEKTKL